MALLRGFQRSAEEKAREGERKPRGRGSATVTGCGVSLKLWDRRPPSEAPLGVLARCPRGLEEIGEGSWEKWRSPFFLPR